MAFFEILIQISKILVVLILAPFSFYNLFIPYNATKREKNFFFCACLGIGIPFVSFIFLLSIRLFQDQSFYTLFFITIVPFFIYSFFNIKNLKLFIIDNFKFPLKLKFTFNFILFFILVLISLLLLSCVLFPVIQNDSIEYFYIAKTILNKSFIQNYPSKDAIDGLILPLTHPLGFPSYIAFGGVLQDPDFQVLNSKFFIVLIPIVISFILIKIAVYEKSIKNPFIATFLILTFPLFFFIAFGFHIDPIRCLTFFSASLFAYLTIKRENYSNYFLLGLSVGLSWFVHSTGLLTLLILFSLVFLINIQKTKKTLIYLTISLLACISVIIFDLIKVYDVMGSIFGDLYTIDIAKQYKEEFLHFRKLDRGVSSISEKFFYGFGRIFFEYRNFGFFYIITLPACFFYFKRKIKHIRNVNSFLDFSSLIVFMFYLGVVFATLIGIETFLQNYRYTLQPILNMALIGSLFIEKVFFRHEIVLFRKA